MQSIKLELATYLYMDIKLIKVDLGHLNLKVCKVTSRGNE